MQKSIPLLNHLIPSQFLAEYWQKKPLLIRQAIPNFKGLLSANELAGLSGDDDVQARLIKQSKGKWQVLNGPFDADFFSHLPNKDWTLLVQSLNHHLPEASHLLNQFNFIPHARLDDLMVSFAPDGGGVGPHVDSYDVFLLQGTGKRLWHVSTQQDLSLVEDAPLKLLKNFVTEQSYILEAGDMLYLPPQVAHWGIAIGNCMTYSIGFRAPKTQELATEFLSFIQDKLALTGIYQDPNLSLQDHPSEISSSMVTQVSEMLNSVTWDNEMIGEFLGVYLSEPSAEVIFKTPRKISVAKFKQHLLQQPILLALKSKMLCHNQTCFINGEKLVLNANLFNTMQKLADARHLLVTQASLNSDDFETLVKLLHSYYAIGYLTFK